MFKRTLILALLIVALASALIAGCGFGGAGTDSGDRVLSKRAYIERINGLHQEISPVFTDISKSTRNIKTAQESLDEFDHFVGELEAINAPHQWRSQHTELIDSVKAMRQSLQILARASASNRRAVTAQLGRYQAANERYLAAVSELNKMR